MSTIKHTYCIVKHYFAFKGTEIVDAVKLIFVKLRQGSGKDRQGMVLKAKGLKA